MVPCIGNSGAAPAAELGKTTNDMHAWYLASSRPCWLLSSGRPGSQSPGGHRACCGAALSQTPVAVCNHRTPERAATTGKIFGFGKRTAAVPVHQCMQYVVYVQVQLYLCCFTVTAAPAAAGTCRGRTAACGLGQCYEAARLAYLLVAYLIPPSHWLCLCLLKKKSFSNRIF
jgi:hypothetical protein